MKKGTTFKVPYHKTTYKDRLAVSESVFILLLRKCVTHYDTFNKLQSVVGFLRKGGIRTAGFFCLSADTSKKKLLPCNIFFSATKKPNNA